MWCHHGFRGLHESWGQGPKAEGYQVMPRPLKVPKDLNRGSTDWNRTHYWVKMVGWAVSFSTARGASSAAKSPISQKSDSAKPRANAIDGMGLSRETREPVIDAPIPGGLP